MGLFCFNSSVSAPIISFWPLVGHRNVLDINTVWIDNVFALLFQTESVRMKTKMLRWQGGNIFCLFNLKSCDITGVPRGHFLPLREGFYFPPLVPPHRTWFTQPIFICASQMVKHNILTASSSQVSEGQRGKARRIPARIQRMTLWGRLVWQWARIFLTALFYFVNVTLLHHFVGVVKITSGFSYLEESGLWFQGFVGVQRNILKQLFEQLFHAWHFWNLSVGKMSFHSTMQELTKVSDVTIVRLINDWLWQQHIRDILKFFKFNDWISREVTSDVKGYL